MIKLENIARKGDIITAHVTLMEGDESSFDITVDVEKRKVLKCDRELDVYVSHARSKLFELGMFSTEKTMPKSATSVWW